MTPEPRFKHGCDACQFLGTTSYVDPFSGAWVDADLYFCPKSESDQGGTVLARVSDEPSHYASSPISMAKDRKAPFSTHGRALFIAWLAVQGGRCPECGNPRLAHKLDCPHASEEPCEP